MSIGIVPGTGTPFAQGVLDLRAALANRVDVAKRGLEMVIGVLTPDLHHGSCR